MGRLADVAPESRTQIVKVDDDTHEIYHIQVIPLGRVSKSREGWKIEKSKEPFQQEQDAIDELYKHAKLSKQQPVRQVAPRIKLVAWDGKAEQLKIGGLSIPTSLIPYNDFHSYKEVRDLANNRVQVFASKQKMTGDKDARKAYIDDPKMSWVSIAAPKKIDPNGP